MMNICFYGLGQHQNIKYKQNINVHHDDAHVLLYINFHYTMCMLPTIREVYIIFPNNQGNL